MLRGRAGLLAIVGIVVTVAFIDGWGWSPGGWGWLLLSMPYVGIELGGRKYERRGYYGRKVQNGVYVAVAYCVGSLIRDIHRSGFHHAFPWPAEFPVDRLLHMLGIATVCLVAGVCIGHAIYLSEHREAA